MGALLALLAAAQTIFIAGDSTAQTYAPARYPQSGWGQVLPCALDGVKVENRAMGGRSTRTFVSEGRWAKLIGDLRQGDTVLIQFGHNDASANKPARYAAAATDYRWNLTRFVGDVRAKGGMPVILTPVTRRSFDAEGRAKADFADYSSVARTVAEETDTPLLDLERLSRDWLSSVGPAASKPFFLHYTPADRIAAFPKGIDDDTHFSEAGARRMADLIAGELRAMNLPVSAHVRAERPGLAKTTGDWRCEG